MKKYFLLLALFASFQLTTLSAQTEIKANPVALIFGVGALGVEYGFNDEFGVELSSVFTGDGAIVWASGKYYFNPREGLDRFHLGLFVAGASEGAGIGILGGTKVVSRKNILFEFGLGLGRSFDGGVLPYGQLSIGYRFRQK